MEKSKKRLKVFQKITGDLKDDSVSRMLELRGASDLNTILSLLYSFGEVQMTDCSNFLYGIIIVSYYDIRVTKAAYLTLESTYSVKYLNYNAEHDYIAVSLAEYEELMSLLATCGEIMYTNKFEDYVTVHFYDIRCARNACCLLNKEKKMNRPKNDADSSVYSDSTSPSPYFLALSTESSNENSFEERRNRKKMNEKEDKAFKINLDAIYKNEDERTTLMIRNIPNKYTQAMLLETINKKFGASYDIFYLPIDFKVYFI